MRFNWCTIAPLLLPFATTAFAAPSVNSEKLVNLRIEGADKTIFEGLVFTKGHNVTTATGGNHHCDGTNLNANPTPGATVTSALADAAKRHNFPFDGPFDPEFDDFAILSIDGLVQTSTQFWGILLNFQFIPVGGCQQEVQNADEILFAFDAFSKAHFLKLTGPKEACVGHPAVFTVTDGMTGAPIAGASVDGKTSGANGKVAIAFAKAGANGVKATKSDSISSNQVNVLVV